jgi:hypothetical protein
MSRVECWRRLLFAWVWFTAISCGRSEFALLVDAAGPHADSANVSKANVVFVTSSAWTGNLAGVDGANLKCQQSANSARMSGLPGFDQTFIALIAMQGTSNYNALALLQGSRGWVRSDGEWVADLPADFVNGERNPALFDETGRLIPPASTLWSGLKTNGTAGADCNNFISMQSGVNADYGGTFRRRHLLSDGVDNCANTHRLLCVGIGRVVTYLDKVVPATGKRMFVSTALF